MVQTRVSSRVTPLSQSRQNVIVDAAASRRNAFSVYCTPLIFSLGCVWGEKSLKCPKRTNRICFLYGGCSFSSLEISTFCQSWGFANSLSEESRKNRVILYRWTTSITPSLCKANHAVATECYHSHCDPWKCPCQETQLKHFHQRCHPYASPPHQAEQLLIRFSPHP